MSKERAKKGSLFIIITQIESDVQITHGAKETVSFSLVAFFTKQAMHCHSILYHLTPGPVYLATFPAGFPHARHISGPERSTFVLK